MFFCVIEAKFFRFVAGFDRCSREKLRLEHRGVAFQAPASLQLHLPEAVPEGDRDRRVGPDRASHHLHSQAVQGFVRFVSDDLI